MVRTIRSNRLILIAMTISLTLIFTQLPSTDVKAASVCIGPSAYPPDLPDCLDPVEEANKQAAIKAAADKLASEAAAIKAAREKLESCNRSTDCSRKYCSSCSSCASYGRSCR